MVWHQEKAFIFVNQKITQKNAVNEIFNGKFGKADSILIEEFLEW